MGASPDSLRPTIISQDLTIVGKFRSRGKVTLNGTVEGDLHCSSLEVSETGRIQGGIVAEEVLIRGSVEGAVYGNSVELLSSANVQGDIYHHGIGIEKGTKYDGRLRYLEDPVQTGKAQEKDTGSVGQAGSPSGSPASSSS